MVFFLFQIMPGDPVLLMMGQRTDPAARKAVEQEYGFDQPLPVQYLYYLNDLSPISFYQEAVLEEVQGWSPFTVFGVGLVLKSPDLRTSIQTNQDVSKIISDRFWGTFILAITAMTFAVFVGIPIGVWISNQSGSWLDRFFLTTTVFGISAPSYVMGALAAYFLAFRWHDVTGLDPFGYLIDIDGATGEPVVIWHHLVLPALTLGIRPLAVIVQLTRSSMLDALSQDYVRTARAKGLPERVVIFKHALRNALNPVITAISGWVASLLAGAFFIEYIFAWKGLGSEMIHAILTLDLPVIMGVTLFVGVVLVTVNIFVDLLYAWVDPRIRISGK